MILQLPVNQDGPLFGFKCELEGILYGFEFRWNQRTEQWFMTVSSSDGVAIASSILVTCNRGLWSSLHALALPPGELIAFDTSNKNQDPVFEDLGRRVVFFYFSSDTFR